MTRSPVAARALARDALSRIERGDAYANLVLPRLLERSDLDERDRRFATELVYGATRMRRALDALLAPHLTRAIDPAVRTVLRLGAYQLKFADVPQHAAVSTSVEVAPKRARGFVNAILRRVAEAPAFAPALAGERLSYPDWIVDRLVADLGERDAIAALEAMNVPSRPHKRADGYVQDPASALVADLVGAQPGERIADVCAAPGGKATALAHQVGTGLVVAGDARATRVGLIAANAHTTGTVDRVAPVVADARMPPWRPGAFARVLVDAPCSGLGVLHRRPDARWRVTPGDVHDLAALARELLAAAATLVAPGGRLVYSVCTLTTAETIGVAEWALDHLTGFGVDQQPDEPWRPRGPGAVLLPQTEGTDGMFVLSLCRSAS